jgi:hypothetical protein
MNDPIELQRCQHVKATGTQCESLAMPEKPFCHYHQQWRPMTIMGTKIVLPLLEDAASIQLAITQVTHMLINFMIDHKTASLALYALQVASMNLKRVHEEETRAAKANKIGANKAGLNGAGANRAEVNKPRVNGSGVNKNGAGVNRAELNTTRANAEPLAEGSSQKTDVVSRSHVDGDDASRAQAKEEQPAPAAANSLGRPICAPGTAETIDPNYTFAYSIDRRVDYFGSPHLANEYSGNDFPGKQPLQDELLRNESENELPR